MIESSACVRIFTGEVPKKTVKKKTWREKLQEKSVKKQNETDISKVYKEFFDK